MLKNKNVSIPLWYQCKIRSEYHIYDFNAPFKVIHESEKACVVSCHCSKGDFTFWVPKSIVTIDNVCYVN